MNCLSRLHPHFILICFHSGFFILFSSYTRTQEDMRSAWNEIGRQVTRQLLSRITRKSGRLLWNGAPDATVALQVTSGLFSGPPSRFSRFMRGSVATPWQSFPVAGHAVTLPSYLSATIETELSQELLHSEGTAKSPSLVTGLRVITRNTWYGRSLYEVLMAYI